MVFAVGVSLNRRSCIAELIETVLPPLRRKMLGELDYENGNCHRQHDNWRNQAMSQACAVCSPVSWGFERNGDISPLETDD